MAFTRRLNRLPSPDEIADALVEEVVQVLDATSAGAYVVEPGERAYRLSARAGCGQLARSVEHNAALTAWLRTAESPTPLPADLLPAVVTSAAPALLGLSIRWRAMLLGFVVLGPRRTGGDYTAEECEYLTTVAEQVATSIMAVRLSQPPSEPRTIETFDRFTASVIHDIKNSVSTLSLLARNAAGNFADPEFQRDAVTTLSRTVERMRRLLVKLSSPVATAPPMRTEPIDLQELIIEATTPLATGARVRLVRDLHPVTTVYGDRDALLRVVENLTTNAAESIDHEGTVTVTLAEEQGHAVISVADTGCGISEDYRERHLFTPFHSTKKGGWGIGLYQTKQAIENQYGEILVRSIEGHGTTFTVKLPLRADVESPSLESVR